jgi:hypothetical protein
MLPRATINEMPELQDPLCANFAIRFDPVYG